MVELVAVSLAAAYTHSIFDVTVSMAYHIQGMRMLESPFIDTMVYL